MINIEVKCPCCQKSIQIVLSDMDTENKVGVLSVKESDIEDKEKQECLEQKLFKTKNIILG